MIDRKKEVDELVQEIRKALRLLSKDIRECDASEGNTQLIERYYKTLKVLSISQKLESRLRPINVVFPKRTPLQ